MGEFQDQAIRQHCKALRMPTIGGQFARLADAANREGQSHVSYLDALLTAEMEERESHAITRMLHKAKLPRMKTPKASNSTTLVSRQRNYAPWPRAITWPTPNPSCWWARLARARCIWRRHCASPPVVSGGGAVRHGDGAGQRTG